MKYTTYKSGYKWKIDNSDLRNLCFDTKKAAIQYLTNAGKILNKKERTLKAKKLLLKSHKAVKIDGWTITGYRTRAEKKNGLGDVEISLHRTDYYRSVEAPGSHKVNPVQYSIHQNLLYMARARKLGIQQNCEYERKYRNYPPYVVDRWVNLAGWLAIQNEVAINKPKYADPAYRRAALKYCKIQEITNSEEIDEVIETLEGNKSTGGTANTAFIAAVKSQDMEYAQDLLGRMEGAAYRHNNTGYDEALEQGIDRESAREYVRQGVI